MKADLHFHSTYSDGELNVNSLVDILKENKVLFACLTDHDSIMGSKEFIDLCKEFNIRTYPSFELSTHNNGEAIHITAYFKNLESISDELKNYLIQMEKIRHDRLKLMTDRINELYDLDISFEKIKEEHPHMLERPHLAEAISRKLNISRKEAFEKYVGNDCPAYIPSSKIGIKEGIDLIHRSNGLAIMAHPYSYRKNNPSELLSLGFDGVEVFYYPTPKRQYKKYLKIVKEKSLLATGGSDFHRIIDERHSPLGKDEIPSPYIDKFIEAIEKL